MSQLVARLLETLDPSSSSSPQRPSLSERRRSSSVPPLRWQDSNDDRSNNATAAMPIYGGEMAPGRRRRRDSAGENSPSVQSDAQRTASPKGILQRPEGFSASPPPAPSTGSNGAGIFQGSRKDRAMSLTLCVDELDLKRGKRASVSATSAASSNSPTDAIFQSGDNPPVPQSGAPVEAMGGNGASSFSTGRPLSFAKQEQQQLQGKRRRLGDPI